MAVKSKSVTAAELTREGLMEDLLKELRREWAREMSYYRALDAELLVEVRMQSPVVSTEELLARRNTARALFLEGHEEFMYDELVLSRQRVAALEARIGELR